MSLPPDYIPEIKRTLDSISSSLPNYKTRNSQKRMIAAVAEVLSRADIPVDDADPKETDSAPKTGNSILCVEGPTGVGKSLAYLIGAAVPARKKGCQIVISTATVALQEQLAERDIPYFLKHAGVNLNFVLAKGRGRYVCHSKLIGLSGSTAQQSLLEEELPVSASQQDTGLAAHLLKEYEQKHWSGDRDQLAKSVSNTFWESVTTDRHSCLGKRCPQKNTCAHILARDGIRQADIVVVNHDLLLSDLALGGGAILTNPKKTFYVLDEGHHFAQKAVDSFATHHYLDAGRSMMEKLSSLTLRIGQSFHSLSPLAAALDTSAQYLAEGLNEAYMLFDNIDKQSFKSMLWRFPDNELPEQACTLGSNIFKTARDICNDLSQLKDELMEIDQSTSTPVLQKYITEVGFFLGRTENMRNTWELLTTSAKTTPIPVAKWVSILIKDNNQIDYAVHAGPVQASDKLDQMFFSKAAGVIVTSATLKSMGSFDQLLLETGLDHYPQVNLLDLPSPFNHAEQATLYVHKLKASAKNHEMHTAAIIRDLPHLSTLGGNKGTLVLFASRRQMNEVAEGLGKEMQDTLLIQGEMPKSLLIDEHVRRIASGRPSVIFGLQSFSEGLDLPRELCTNVILAKLPFATPIDPVQLTLEEWLSSQKRSYFDEIAVPQACLRVIQSAGRLLRTEDDQGILIFLDDRITNTAYGRRILNSLPPFKQLSNIPVAAA